MEFVLIQHAEKDRASDALADPGLTERGREQARVTGERLRALGVRRVVASPLRRAHETARIVAEALGLDRAAVETDARLRERMNWGTDPISQTLSEFLADWARATADRDYAPPAGDSSHTAGARVYALLEELAAGAQGADGQDTAATQPPAAAIAPVALVTHGGVTVDLLRTLFGDDHVCAVAPHLIARGVPGCALSRLSRGRDGSYCLLGCASVDHLPLSLRTDWTPPDLIRSPAPSAAHAPGPHLDRTWTTVVPPGIAFGTFRRPSGSLE
jgi:broad specificity phosphatase PhoE